MNRPSPKDLIHEYDRKNDPQTGWVVVILFGAIAALWMFAPLFEGVK